MNQQRINELAVEAGAYWRDGYVEQPSGDHTWCEKAKVDTVDMDLNKYTKLVLNECEKVAKDGSWYYDAPSCGWRNPINFVCSTMKEHFGVKE